jgi:hypothetical protein
MLAAALGHVARCALHIAQDEDAPFSESPDHDANASIQVCGIMLTGVRVGGKGEYTNALGWMYRGQANDAKADGLGVLTFPDGGTWSGEWSAGVRHGHTVSRNSGGHVWYFLHDRGNVVHDGWVVAGRVLRYDHQRCTADDARVLALAAAALDAAVRRIRPVAA